MKKFFLILFVFLIGCVFPARIYQYENTRVINISRDRAWERAVEFFASNVVTIKTIEKESNIIAAEKRISIESKFVDCGEHAFQPIQPNGILEFNVFLKPLGGNKIKVSVNSWFSEARYYEPLTRDFEPVPCNSRGVLETELLDYIEGK